MNNGERRYFERARAAVDLIGFVVSVYGKPRLAGPSPRWGVCPHCGESSKDSLKLVVRRGHYSCFSCGKGGSVVDFAAAIRGTNLVEAAQWLLNEPTMPAYTYQQESDEEEQRRKALAADVIRDLRPVLIRQKPSAEIMRYLTVERAIPLAVVQEAVDRKILGFMPANPTEAKGLLVETVGEQRLRDAGLWKDGSKAPGICYRQLVFFMNTGAAEFRVIRPREGQAKAIRYGVTNCPFFWGGSSGVTKVVEGAIDMLSEVALSGAEDNIVGLPGCNQYDVRWFTKLHADARACRIEVRLDNDVDKPKGKNPGQEWAARLIADLTEQGIPAINTSPEAGDVNDLLRSRPAVA